MLFTNMIRLYKEVKCKPSDNFIFDIDQCFYLDPALLSCVFLEESSIIIGFDSVIKRTESVSI